MPLLSIQDLSVSFATESGRVSIVEHVGFDVEAGEIVGLVGESGCGKSVTAMSIMQLLPPDVSRVDTGQVTFEGTPLVGLDESRMCAIRGDRIGMIFQEPMTSLNPTYTVGFQIAVNSTPDITMQQCATSSSHYYNASSGEALKQAFRDIALKISDLRISE